MEQRKGNTFHVTPIVESNVSELKRLYRENFSNDYARTTGARLRRDILQKTNYSGLYAVCGDEIAGEITYKRKMSKNIQIVYICTLSVRHKFRRQGVAHVLFQHLFEETHGANQYFLHTEVDNTASQQLYKKIGFLITKRVPRYYNTLDGYELTLVRCPILEQ